MTELSDFRIGQLVELADGHTARVQFVGNTHFAPGDWVGVVFDEALGKNDGSVQGQRYFDCPTGHGMFIRPSVATILEELATPKPAARAVGRANGTAKKNTPSTTTNTVLKRQRLGDPASAKRQSINENSPTPTARVSRLSRPGESPTKPPRPSPSPSLSTPSRSNTPTTRKSIIPPVSSKRTSMGPPPPPSANHRAASRPSIAGTLNRPSKVSSQSSSTSRDPTKRLSIRSGTGERIGSTSGESRNSTPDRHDLPDANADGRESSPTKPSQEEETVKDDVGTVIASPLSPASGLASPGSQTSGISEISQQAKPARGRSPGSVSQRPIPATAAQKRQIEDLETKLRMAEKRIEEDREKFKEMEKVKAERDRYEGVIQKLQTKYQPQQQEIVELKRLKKDSESRIEALEAKQAESDSIHEMATLDKEMAEELADSMKLELQSIRQKFDELELEAEILREENQELGKEISPSEKTSQGWLQLERSNERYREALMRLRDVTQEQEADLRDQITSLEQDLQDFVKVKDESASTNERLAEADATVEDLRQQLDAALGGEEIIEELTEKNLTLNERIDELGLTIQDLEALKELNDELELNHTENEKQLQDEIDYSESLLADEFRKSAVQDGAIQDLEYTISRFRDLVNTLQSDLEEMRSSQQITEAQASDLSVKSRAIMEMNMKLQTSASKTQIKAIDLELGKLQASESVEHLAIVQNFLPEAFNSERDSIQALLRFRRIKFKARLLQNSIKERFSNTSTTEQDEEVFSYFDISDKLIWISSTCDRFISTVETCDADTFKRLGAASYELEPVERGMNVWIEGLKQNELKAVQCATELPRFIALMAHLAEVHISQNLEHFADDVLLRAMIVQSHLENITAALLRIQSLVEAKLSSFSVSEEEEEQSLQISSRIDSLLSQARTAKVVSGKTIRQLEDLKSRCVTLDPSTLPTIEQSEQSSAELVSAALELGTSLGKLSVGDAQTEPISSQVIFTTLQNGPTSLSAISSKLQATTTSINNFNSLTTSLTQAIEFPAPSSVPPWKQLAQEMKAANADLAARELEMTRLKDEVTEKNTALAMKDKVAEETGVKLEVLEKRVGESGGRRERLKELEEASASAKVRETDLKTKLATLQSDLQQAETDRDKWQATAQTKTTSSTPGTHPTAATTTSPTDPTATSTFSLHQISALKSEIETLHATIRYLQTASHAHTLSTSLSFLSHPITPPASPPPKIHSEAKAVLNEMLTLATDPDTQLLKLHPRPAAERLRWRPVRETTSWQLQRQREEWEEWREWRDAVAKRAAAERRQRQRVAAAALGRLDGGDDVASRGKAVGEKEALPLAELKVQMPGKGGMGGRDMRIVEPGDWGEVQDALEVRVG